MRVLVLGAGGFIGSRLVARLLRDGRVGDRPISELCLFDVRALPAVAGAPFPVASVHGDLRDRHVLDQLFERPADVVFHLAATLTLEAETDFRRGIETNVLAFIELLERCRAQKREWMAAPMLLFASSISTFGGELPEVVGDDTFQAPATSYGTHKAIAELLLADYSRNGFVDGRALRLPIVVTHPGPPSGSISDQVASLLREPLRGQRAVCRMAPDSRMALASVDNVIDAFLRLAALPADALPPVRTMNLPGLTVTPAQLEQAVRRRLGAGAGAFIEWRPDAQVQRIIDGWPQVFTSERALALGIRPDADAGALVDAFLSSESTRP